MSRTVRKCHHLTNFSKPIVCPGHTCLFIILWSVYFSLRKMFIHNIFSLSWPPYRQPIFLKAILHQTELSFEMKPEKMLPKKWQKWQILSDDICKLFQFLFIILCGGLWRSWGSGSSQPQNSFKIPYTVHTRRSSMKYSFCIFTHMQIPHTIMHEGRFRKFRLYTRINRIRRLYPEFEIDLFCWWQPGICFFFFSGSKIALCTIVQRKKCPSHTN